MSTPAPNELALIEAFVNTWDLEDDEEALSIPAALSDWLAGHGLAAPGEAFDHEDLARAIAVREALRALLLANNEDALDPAAPATLSAAADRAQLTSPSTRTAARASSRAPPASTASSGGCSASSPARRPTAPGSA